MSEPVKALVTPKVLGKQLYLLAYKIADNSTIGSLGSRATGEAKAQVISAEFLAAVEASSRVKNGLFLEEIIFALWAADICLTNKDVSTSMFSDWIDELYAKAKPGTDIEQLSMHLREAYVQRYSLYANAVKKDAANGNTGPISEVTEARLFAINSVLPDQAKLSPSNLFLRFLLQTEWNSTLKCFETAIAQFKIADGKRT